MAKVRVYELAKQLGVETKEVVATLAANGIEVKSQKQHRGCCDRDRRKEV